MKPQFWSVRMFAALWGVMFAPLAPALADTQVSAGAVEPEPIVQLEWSNMIGGDAVTFLHAIPKAMRLAKADEGDIAVARMVVRAIELIGKGAGHASLKRIEMTPGEDEPDFEFQISVDLGDQLPDLLELIQKIAEQAGEAEEMEQVDVSGVSFTQLDDEEELLWGTVGGRFLFSSSASGAKELVEDSKRKTPGASKNVSRVRAKVGADPDSPWMISIYVDVPAVIENVREVLVAKDELPPKFDSIVDELGLKGLRSVYIHGDDKNGGPVSRTLLETDGSKKGLLSLWDQKPLERADLELIPQDASWAAACSFDLEQLWNRTHQAIEAIDPNVAMQIDGGLGMVSAMFGIDPVHQVLPAFGDTWVIYDAPDHGGLLITGAVLVVEVDGPDALNAAVTQLCAMANPMLMQAGYELVVKETIYKGYTISYIVMPGLPVPISPAAAYVDGRVVVGLSPQVVKVALHQADPALRKSSILDHPDVKKLAGDPAGKVQTFYYWNLKHQARAGYKITHLLRTAAASLLAGNADETDIADLPTLPELLDGAENYVAVCRIVDNDILYEEKGSLFLWDAAFGNFSLATTAMAISILSPSLSRARELAKRAVSASNLRGIGIAVQIYAHDHDGQFPPDFDALIDGGMITPGMLISPRHGGDVSYVYVKGQKEGDNPRNVLAYEKVIGDEGTNVLLLDGHVEWMDVESFARALAETEKRLGRAGVD